MRWMDESTRNAFIEKVKAMQTVIAHPEEILETSRLENYYNKLEVTSGNYLENILNVTSFTYDVHSETLRMPTNKRDWVFLSVLAAKVDAYYLYLNNIIGNYIIRLKLF